MEGTTSKLSTNEIRCPYCRKKQSSVLPYYEDLLIEKINGVNYYVSDEVNGLIYKIEKDGEIGRCVGKILNGLPIFK